MFRVRGVVAILVVAILPISYAPTAAQDAPGDEQTDPSEPPAEPIPDDEVIVVLPPDIVDPTNTQVGPEITAAELYREQHFHSAEVVVGAAEQGVEPSYQERLADLALNSVEGDYWIEGGDAGEAEPFDDGETAALAITSYTNIYIQAHPDDEASMLGYIDEFGNNSNYHKVFAVLTRGEQTNYCNYSSSTLNPGEIPPSPAPTGLWAASCDSARINSFMNFLGAAGNLYSHIDTSYTYHGAVSLSSSDPVDPCVRDFTTDGDDTGLHIGVDSSLDAMFSDARFTCTNQSQADDVRIYKGASGYSTVLFFNLGHGDLSINEVKWAMKRIAGDASLLQVPAGIRRYVIAPFANSFYDDCTPYVQPDHRAVHVGVFTLDISSIEQLGSTCDTDPDADRFQAVPSTVWNAWFKSSSSVNATSLHDRHYGWLLTGLWSHPYSSGKCFVNNNYASGEENCLHSRLQNYWSEF